MSIKNPVNVTNPEAQGEVRHRYGLQVFAWTAGTLMMLIFLAAIFDKDTDTSGPLVKAVAVIPGPTVEGTVFFAQESLNGPVKISGFLKNVTPSAERGFHIHELGDVTNGCMSAGSHYNPKNKAHGAPGDSERHIGDLGNVRSDSSGIVALDISDHEISLHGKYSIIGRTVVVHEGMDDLGRGNNGESLKTGNARGRAGCAVIGIAAS